MPAGAKMAKNSFVVSWSGEVSVGPLFLMEKMDGFNADTHDSRYTMIMPDGNAFGVTGGQNSCGMEFCNSCHGIVAEAQDALYFLPEALPPGQGLGRRRTASHDRPGGRNRRAACRGCTRYTGSSAAASRQRAA